METIPVYISLTFIITTCIAVLLFYKAANYSKPFLLVLIALLAIQAVISLKGFYTVTNAVPPRLPILVLPALILIAALFVTEKGRQFIDRLDIKILTLFHIVRVPVELVLFQLYLYKVVPHLMTFEGRNFDILSGLSAPLIYYFGFVTKQVGKKGLIAWNVICLGLLMNIVINAILSVPSSLQQFAFDQPNTAILHFPFTWLPGCLVPLVLFAHLATIRRLVKGN